MYIEVGHTGQQLVVNLVLTWSHVVELVLVHIFIWDASLERFSWIFFVDLMRHQVKMVFCWGGQELWWVLSLFMLSVIARSYSLKCYGTFDRTNFPFHEEVAYFRITSWFYLGHSRASQVWIVIFTSVSVHSFVKCWLFRFYSIFMH
jgi:hypothetical protein